MKKQKLSKADIEEKRQRVLQDIFELDNKLDSPGLNAAERSELQTRYNNKLELIKRIEAMNPVQTVPLPRDARGGAFQAFCQALNVIILKKEPNVKLYDFEMPWWNSKQDTTANKLHVRACYQTLFDQCESARLSDQGRFLLEGSPGTGKSGFGLYCIIRYVQAGHLVWYRYKEFPPYVFIGSDSARELLEKHLAPQQFVTGEVYPLHKDSIPTLAGIDGIVCIFDPPVGPLQASGGNSFDIVVSSPDVDKLNEIRKSPTTIRRYLPLWTLDEIQMIRQFHRIKGITPSENDIATRFRTFGGVPRTIFSSSAQNDLDDAVRNANLEELKSFFNRSNKGPLKPVLIHMNPNDAMDRFVYVFASSDVENLLFNQFKQSWSNDLTWWLAVSRGDGEMQGLRGKLKEHIWHRELILGGKFQLKGLGSHSNPIAIDKQQTSVVQIPLMSFVSFQHLPALTIVQDQYYRPSNQSFKTFDSFAILKRELFEPSSSTELCIVGFQMTVSNAHPLLKSGFDDIQAAVDKYFPDLPFIIVFVTEVSGINTAQTVTMPTDNAVTDDVSPPETLVKRIFRSPQAPYVAKTKIAEAKYHQYSLLIDKLGRGKSE
jgi:hypothetical protein